MTTVPTSEQPAPQILAEEPDPRRWLALGIIAIAQLMIVVDGSIVNIALPSAQKALHISNADRQWVVTAYTLAFGGLLLLGGRIADYVGRKRIFVIGLLGFAAASAVGGLAVDSAMLFGARALQGMFAALMAPAALSLLTVTFTDPEERAKAFGVYGAIAGGGLAIGLILGGILTEFASWRWCLLVNVPIGVITSVAAFRVVHESKAEGDTHYDLPGAITVTAGLTSLVYGMTKAGTDGWGSTTALAFLIAAAVLLVVFVLIERRTPHPLLPLRVVTERNRAGAFLTSLIIGAALFGLFLFLTYYLQGTRHYSALRSGFAFLPLSVGIVASAAGASFLLTRLPPRVIMTAGTILTGLGLLWFTQIGVHTSYVAHILPSEILMSMGLGLVFVPISSVGLFGIDDRDAGVASALVNATQQVGGSIGTALLNTIAASALSSYLAEHLGKGHHIASVVSSVTAKADVHSYTTAFTVSAGFVALALIVTLVLINARTEDVPSEGAIGV
jgi:EmrB/QacA subfamily drug resistance transporter